MKTNLKNRNLVVRVYARGRFIRDIHDQFDTVRDVAYAALHVRTININGFNKPFYSRVQVSISDSNDPYFYVAYDVFENGSYKKLT